LHIAATNRRAVTNLCVMAFTAVAFSSCLVGCTTSLKYCGSAPKDRLVAFESVIMTPPNATKVHTGEPICESSTNSLTVTNGYQVSAEWQSAVVGDLSDGLKANGWVNHLQLKGDAAEFERSDGGLTYWAELLTGPGLPYGTVSLVLSAGVAPY
jgi:hypothetical protein